MRRIAIGTSFFLTIAATSLSAETLAVGVRRPAIAQEVYALRRLAVDRFDGTDGRTMASAVERAISGIRDASGGPVYSLFEPSAADGVVNGRADVNVEERRSQQTRKLCPDTRDPKVQCDDKLKEPVEITCRRRIMTFEADLRVVRTGDGRLMYTRQVPLRDEVLWCPGDVAPLEVSAAVANFVDQATGSFVGELSPYDRVEMIRIREDRKGLPADAAAIFKEAVRTTKASGTQACAMFAGLEASAPVHPALAFNLGLCAEGRGDYDDALRRYRAMGGDRDAVAAAERVMATRAADAIDRQRNGERR